MYQIMDPQNESCELKQTPSTIVSANDIVYVLENRGNSIFSHWFLYVISGLHDLSHLPKPIQFHTDITDDFQRDTIALLAPDYKFIENIDGYKTVVRHGAPCKTVYSVEDHYYHFVRNEILIKNKLEITQRPFRRVYICRSRSHLIPFHYGIKRRQIVDEDILVDLLQKNGIECLHLEDYTLYEKIRLFQESELIISPNGGALTGCYFANKDTKIILITNHNPAEYQYIHICTILSIPFACYENVQCFDNNGAPVIPRNMCEQYSMKIPDYDDFLRFIETAKPSQRSISQ